MDILTGLAESVSPSPRQPQPWLTPETPVYPSEVNKGDPALQGDVFDATADQAERYAEMAADAGAAEAAAHAAELDRRTGYAADITPQGAEYGDTVPVAQPVSGPGVGLSDNDLPVKGMGY